MERSPRRARADRRCRRRCCSSSLWPPRRARSSATTPAATTATATPATVSARTAAWAPGCRSARSAPTAPTAALESKSKFMRRRKLHGHRRRRRRSRRRVGRPARLGGAVRGRVALRVGGEAARAHGDGVGALPLPLLARVPRRPARVRLHRDGARRLRRVGGREGGGDEDALSRVARRGVRPHRRPDLAARHRLPRAPPHRRHPLAPRRPRRRSLPVPPAPTAPPSSTRSESSRSVRAPSASRRLRSPGSGTSSSAA